MDGYCLAHLFKEDKAIEAEAASDRNQLRFDNTCCWVCGAPIVEVHCKIVCQHCGFTRDCSDP